MSRTRYFIVFLLSAVCSELTNIISASTTTKNDTDNTSTTTMSTPTTNDNDTDNTTTTTMSTQTTNDNDTDNTTTTTISTPTTTTNKHDGTYTTTFSNPSTTAALTSTSTSQPSKSTTDSPTSTTESSTSTSVRTEEPAATAPTSQPTTTDPLVSSANVSGLLMYVKANLNVSTNDLTYNYSHKQRLVQDFSSEMSTLLKNTTGFLEIRVTGMNDNEWFRNSYRIKRSTTHIVFYFDLVLLGGTDLKSTNYSLPLSVNHLHLLDTQVNVMDWGSLQNTITEAEKKLNKSVCSVYSSVEKCNMGSYTCQLSNGMITCTHLCRNYDRCAGNGQCYFDDIQKDTMCRCKEDGGRYYTGPACNVEAYKLALPLGAVIGINAGLGGALLLVILVFAVRIIRNRKETRGKEESSYKLSGFERGRESPWELKHYDDLWQHRQWRADGEANSFSERPYIATQDSLGNPIYMYRPDDRNEPPYTELKPGSSLSNLNLPESKFEISRPKIVISRLQESLHH